MAAFASSYIKTVASQVTRAADSASMTGANFSSWYNQAEGTLSADYVSGPSNNTQAIFVIDDGTFNNRISLYNDTSTGGVILTQALVSVGGATQAGLTFASAAPNTPHKMALAYKVNDFAGVFDGGSVVVDTLGTLPTVDKASFGTAAAGPQFLNGTIRKISYYPVRVTNAQLQGLTS